MPSELSGLVRDVIASPLGDVIASVGEGVAAAQRALDEAAVAQTLEIYSEGGEELVRMLREIGYRPTFYALPETVGEVKVTMRLSGGSTASPPPAAPAAAPQPGSVAALPRLPAIGVATLPRVRTYVTPVDAGYANRYNFDAEASAKLTFKIVPVPPPSGMDDVRVVPRLVGLTASAAGDLLATIGLEARFLDANGEEATPAAGATVRAAAPPAETVVRLGATIDLTLA
jgi:hypothetical protein